jgi:hypothetical protein
MGARMRAGIEAALRPRDGFRPEKMVLLTLTIAHSGDVGRDRAELAAGWRRFRQAYHRRWGWFPYCGVWEVTPGDDELGHVHAHVAVVWPWRDWGEIRALWCAACPRSQRITLVASRRDGKPSTPGSVANYLAKYLAKGSQAIVFTPELMSRVLAGTYNTRWVFSSRGFWQYFEPKCRRCNCRIRVTQFAWHGGSPYLVPESLPDWAGSAFGERGPPQSRLPLPEPN